MGPLRQPGEYLANLRDCSSDRFEKCSPFLGGKVSLFSEIRQRKHRALVSKLAVLREWRRAVLPSDADAAAAEGGKGHT